MKNLSDKIMGAAVMAVVMLQAWTLKEVVALKVSVAKIETRIEGVHRRETATVPEPSKPLAKNERNP